MSSWPSRPSGWASQLPAPGCRPRLTDADRHGHQADHLEDDTGGL